MASVSLSLSTINQPPGPAPAQQETAPGPQANATQTQGAAPQQDTVTLAGRGAESQPARSGGGNGNSGEASSYFLAERQSFRASSGSAATHNPGASTPPSLPVKLSNSVAATGSSESEDAENTSVSAAADDATSDTSPANGGANAATDSANAASSAPATVNSSQTPLAELTQLDQTLQQLGINPQSISLFNRMAMLLYANDPAALKVLIQTLQTGAGSATSAANNAASSAGGQQVSAADVQSLLPAESQAGATSPPPNSQPQVPQNPSIAASSQNAVPQYQAFMAQEMPIWRALSWQGDAQLPATQSSSSGDSSNASAQMAQMQELQQALVSVGAQSQAPQGEILNITA